MTYFSLTISLIHLRKLASLPSVSYWMFCFRFMWLATAAADAAKGFQWTSTKLNCLTCSGGVTKVQQDTDVILLQQAAVARLSSD